MITIRKQHPRMGVRKLHHMLRTKHGLSYGRDRLFSLAKAHHLLVKRKRRAPGQARQHETNRATNLTVQSKAQRSGDIWVSDITYLSSKHRVYGYLSLVTDAYSRKIIGYHVNESLSTSGPLKALQKALRRSPRSKGVIHHSDGGAQYTSSRYRKALEKQGMLCSMTAPSSPQQNPIAERINGILKQ